MKDFLLKSIIPKIIGAFHIFLITLIIPILLFIIYCFIIILDISITKSFLDILHSITIEYYFTGYFLDIEAWRWHLAFLFFGFLISNKDYYQIID